MPGVFIPFKYGYGWIKLDAQGNITEKTTKLWNNRLDNKLIDSNNKLTDSIVDRRNKETT